MKKFLALLISVALVMALFAIPAAAEGEVVFTASTVDDVAPGSDVTVTLDLTGGDYEAHTLYVLLEYDNTMLTATSVDRGEVLTNAMLDLGAQVILNCTTPDAGDGLYRVKVACIVPGDQGALATHGNLCTVHFHVSESCTTNQPIHVNVTSFVYSPLEGGSSNVPFIANDGAINIAGGTTPTEPPTPTDPPAPVESIIWDFETDPEAQGWSFEDHDGDGYAWNWCYGEAYAQHVFYEGSGFIKSMSYAGGVVLYPDNWAITPEFEVPANGEISFWANGQDPSYAAEVFGAYVIVGGQEIKLGADVTVGANPTEYTYDLSDYEGETVRFAVRHYNISDMFHINVDYFVVNGEGGTTPPTPTNPPQPPVETKGIFQVESLNDVEPGSQITVKYMLDGEFDANIINTALSYDASVLEFVSAVPGAVLTGNDVLTSIDGSVPGTVYVGAILPEGSFGTGVLVTLTFNVSENFTEPTYITIGVDEFAYLDIESDQGVDVDYETIDGVITPAEPVTPTDPPQPPVGHAVFTMEGKENVAPGSEITLNFTLTGEYAAHVIGAVLNYDTSVLTLVNVEAGEVLTGLTPNDAYVIDGDTIPGSVRIGVICGEEPTSATGVVVSLTFKVSDKFDAPTTIEVEIPEFGLLEVGDVDLTPVDFEAVPGVVTPATAPGPNPPVTGFVSLAGLGVLAIAAGAGVVIFRKKED